MKQQTINATLFLIYIHEKTYNFQSNTIVLQENEAKRTVPNVAVYTRIHYTNDVDISRHQKSNAGVLGFVNKQFGSACLVFIMS